MNFRKAEDPVSAGLWTAAVLILVCTLLFILIVRPPTAEAAVKAANSQVDSIKSNAKASNDQIVMMQAAISKHDWQMSSDELMPKAMSQTSTAAAQAGVSMASFRPGKPGVVGNAELIPISITADGLFPNIVSFLRKLEALKKISVASIQISELGNGNGQVQAIITANTFTTTLDTGGTDGTAKNQ